MLAVSEVKDELLALKRRQDMVFKKQDIIHSTLAGEIPSGMQSFRSPSIAPSVVAWSPPFPTRPMQQQQPHQMHLSGYSSPVNIESISNDDVQSFTWRQIGGRE